MASEVDILRQAIRAAQVYGKGQYFEREQPGNFKLEAHKIFYKRTMIDGVPKESIICEFKVLESSRPEVIVDSTRTVIYSFHHKGWLGRFKAMLLALIGETYMTPAADDLITDLYVALRDDSERQRLQLPENFLAGRTVFLETFPDSTKGGNPVTGMKWEPCVEKEAA